MKIYIGTDHAGYVLKNKLVSSLKGQRHEVIDILNIMKETIIRILLFQSRAQFQKIQIMQGVSFLGPRGKEKLLRQINFLMLEQLFIMAKQSLW